MLVVSMTVALSFTAAGALRAATPEPAKASVAQRGQQASCEALLGETRKIYDHYAAEVRSGHVPKYDGSGFRQAQLATAQPVAGQNVSCRSDQLIGTEVLNPKGEALGSVDDLVLSPQSGKIVYLVIARGGLFGIDQKYVPVPWAHFKATTGAKMLVLDTTKADMVAAPPVKGLRFSAADDFDKQSQQVAPTGQRTRRSEFETEVQAHETINRDMTRRPSRAAGRHRRPVRAAWQRWPYARTRKLPACVRWRTNASLSLSSAYNKEL